MSDNYTIDKDRWAKLDIFNQMGNIYSEVGRSFKHQADPNNLAIARALELFDATISAQTKAKSPKAKEVARSKEQFLAIVNDSNASQQAIQSLDRYFMQFAVAARLTR